MDNEPKFTKLFTFLLQTIIYVLVICAALLISFGILSRLICWAVLPWFA